MRLPASPFDPRLFIVSRAEGGAVGAFAAHIDETLRRGEPDVPAKIRVFFGISLWEGDGAGLDFVHVGVGISPEDDFAVKLIQEEFTQNPKPLGTSPGRWAARQRTLSPEAIKSRQCKSEEFCWLATVSGPDIRARPARISPRVKVLTGSDVCGRYGRYGRTKLRRYGRRRRN